ncbi:hypothetical protein OAU13_00020 [bacterium]|nr:hypothetical protein [bacterium]
MATKVNLVVDQGTTFTTSITFNDENGNTINFSTYSGAAQLRKHFTSSNSTSFEVSLTSNGVVTLSLTANQTGNLVAGRYVYDLEVTDSSNQISRLIEGIVTVTPNVTR